MAQMEPYAQLHPVLAASVYHIQGLGNIHGHRFFDQYVLAGLGSHFHVPGVEVVRGGNEDRLDLPVLEEVL